MAEWISLYLTVLLMLRKRQQDDYGNTMMNDLYAVLCLRDDAEINNGGFILFLFVVAGRGGMHNI